MPPKTSTPAASADSTNNETITIRPEDATFLAMCILHTESPMTINSSEVAAAMQKKPNAIEQRISKFRKVYGLNIRCTGGSNSTSKPKSPAKPKAKDAEKPQGVGKSADGAKGKGRAGGGKKSMAKAAKVKAEQNSDGEEDVNGIEEVEGVEGEMDGVGVNGD